MSPSATVLDDAVYLLAEGPSWNAERQALQWVDIDNGRFFEGRLTDAGLESRVVYQGERTVGAAVHAEDGGYLVADVAHLVRLDAAGNRLGDLRIIPDGVPSRFNDGACDPAGRYLVGTLAWDGRPGGEALYRVEHSGEVTLLDHDLTISNGLGWSPDGGTFYSIDSVGPNGTGTVWARDYDPDSGTFGQRRLFLASDGNPDGMVIDSVGNLWMAMWGLGEVRCYSPQAELVEVVSVSAPLTSSAAFIGADLATLLITTCSRTEPGIAQTPDAGKLFTAEVPIPGRPTRAWRPAF
jgi:sugar lactone lactonase YvrE